jgi:hypothetical protein
MSKSPEVNKSNRNLKRRLTAGILTLATAMGAPAATAVAEQPGKERLHPLSTRLLEKRTEANLRQGKPVSAFKGTFARLVFLETGGAPYAPSQTGGAAAPAERTEWANVGYPLVVFRGRPNQRMGHDDLRNGDYAFGSIAWTNGQPDVSLYNFKPASMALVAGEMSGDDQVINGIVFGDNGSGGRDGSRPFTTYNNQLTPLNDEAGNPLAVIGLPYRSMK